jgi:hypothetical protein
MSLRDSSGVIFAGWSEAILHMDEIALLRALQAHPPLLAMTPV